MAFKIKLVKSLAGRHDKHIGDETTQPDNEATRGKIKAISYLVEVKEEA